MDEQLSEFNLEPALASTSTSALAAIAAPPINMVHENRGNLLRSLQDWMLHYSINMSRMTIERDVNQIGTLFSSLYADSVSLEEQEETSYLIGEVLTPFLQFPLPHQSTFDFVFYGNPKPKIPITKPREPLRFYQALGALFRECPVLKDNEKFKSIWSDICDLQIDVAIREDLTKNMWKDVHTHLTGDIPTRFMKGQMPGQEKVQNPPKRVSLNDLIFDFRNCLTSYRKVSASTKSPRQLMIITTEEIDLVQKCLSEWKRVTDFFAKPNDLTGSTMFHKTCIHKTLYAFHTKFIFEYYLLIITRFLDIVSYKHNYTTSVSDASPPAQNTQPNQTIINGAVYYVPTGYTLQPKVNFAPLVDGIVPEIEFITVANMKYPVPKGYEFVPAKVHVSSTPASVVDWSSSINEQDQRSTITMFTSLLKNAQLEVSSSDPTLSADLLDVNSDYTSRSPSGDSETKGSHARFLIRKMTEEQFPLPRTRDFINQARLFIGDLYRFAFSCGNDDSFRSCLKNIDDSTNLNLVLRRCAHVRAVAWLFHSASKNAYNLICQGTHRFFEQLTATLMHDYIKKAELSESEKEKYRAFFWFIGSDPSCSDSVQERNNGIILRRYSNAINPHALQDVDDMEHFTLTYGLLSRISSSDLMDKIKYFELLQAIFPKMRASPSFEYSGIYFKYKYRFYNNDFGKSQYKESSFRVGVIGECGSGKSTLVGSLVGEKDLLQNALCEVELRYVPESTYQVRFIPHYEECNEFAFCSDMHLFLSSSGWSREDRESLLFFWLFESMGVSPEDSEEKKKEVGVLVGKIYRELDVKLKNYNETHYTMMECANALFSFLQGLIAGLPFDGRALLRCIFKRALIEGPFTHLPVGVSLVDCLIPGNSIPEFTCSHFNVVWFTTDSSCALERPQDQAQLERVLKECGLSNFSCDNKRIKPLHILLTKCDDPVKGRELVKKVSDQVVSLLELEYCEYMKGIIRKTPSDRENYTISEDDKTKISELVEEKVTISTCSCSSSFLYMQGQGTDVLRKQLKSFSSKRFQDIKNIHSDIETIQSGTII